MGSKTFEFKDLFGNEAKVTVESEDNLSFDEFMLYKAVEDNAFEVILILPNKMGTYEAAIEISKIIQKSLILPNILVSEDECMVMMVAPRLLLEHEKEWIIKLPKNKKPTNNAETKRKN